ncbi:type II CRISPR-associated endonuclease Cas1 [Tractidigestivibacter scatoligenes]|jgi:CRISPR-associated protein Cas1|uniref:type II CRISPR-associated endonuclease Cas1 n=1 Tax=Tractidigestivibacter scatoligenes TaxID=1299998 RepID=UPI002F358A56
MPKRTVCIQNPASLAIKDDALAISQRGELRGLIPLEDIWVLIIETHQAQITTSALSKFSDAGIGVMFCGDDHMPNGLLLPLGAHSRHAAIVDDQLAISKPMQKRLWQRIVKAKISNQAAVLELLGLDGSSVKAVARDVLSGDTSNRESVAASQYFKKLLPKGGRRSSPLTPALDYGYTVLRAGIGRMAVSGGWLVSRGIHHCNNLNAFNLVDDLIEPFRPIVDLLVIERSLGGPLTSENKRELASVFEYLVSIPLGRVPVQIAIENELETLKTAVKSGDASLLELPGIIPLEKASLE